MRIKKLELIGFKSFKDRTVIQFDAGITGVVGPNGCGKSNIVDALMWVMGDQSAKDLRASAMTDVIFAGAEGYAPLGMCEVSLTLENDGGPFPAKYLKHSEIMVTRKLHRNGEGEYFINKEPARLKDVQEIFMDTGAGSKGFSIIAQGMIGKIITAKPEDRRMLIEEAAGITKFKARKKESQRKLISTDQNLVRLQDIIGELKRQIDSLQRQAQRAERYRNIKTQIEDLELWLSSAQYVNLKQAADEAQRIFDEAQSIEVGSEANLASMQSELETLKLSVLEQEKAVEAKQQDFYNFQTSVQKKEMEIQELRFELEQAKRNEQMTGNILSEQKARHELLARDLSFLVEQADTLKIESEELAADSMLKSEAFSSAQARYSQIDTELTEKRRQQIALGQSESALDAQTQSFLGRKSELESSQAEEEITLNELRETLHDFEGRRRKVLNQLEQERQLQMDLSSDVTAFETNKKILTEQLQQKQVEVQDFKDNLNETASRLYGLENLAANFEGFEEGVKQVMLWSKAKSVEMHADGTVSEFFKPVSEVVEVPADYEIAMEAALGSKLQMLLSQKPDTAVEAVDHLKSQNSGRSSFYSNDGHYIKHLQGNPKSETGVIDLLKNVVNSNEIYQSKVSEILDGVAIVDSIRTALRLRPNYKGWTFVTMDGDTLSADGVLTGGSKDSAESGVLKRRREIKELSDKKNEWAGKLALATAALKKVEEQLANVVSDFEGAQQRRIEQEIKVAELKKDYERADVEFNQAQNAVEKQEKEVRRVAEQIEQLSEKIEDLESRLVETRTQKLELETSLAELSTEYNSMKDGFESQQSEVMDLQVRAASKAQEYAGVSRQLDMVQKQVNDLESQLSRMSEEAEGYTSQMSEGQYALEQAKIDFERMLADVEARRLEVSQVKNQFEMETSHIRELEDKVITMQRERNERLSKMNDAQLKLEQAKMKEQYLIDQVREKYMLILPDVVEKYAGREGDPVVADAELKDLRDKLAKIGEVNLSAITEFSETQERYAFLTQQHADLTEAKEQLRKVIDRINKICAKRFKETFDLVNDRFQKVFPVLFGGGEAMLQLVEDEDKGEMGIEIIAKPPGKKMQNVTLMSGGEKALTAVALVFSIFLVKPSPYCLLDEVDAPLDDANVFRFNDLVKEMAKRSQIIVVTHNKHTMEVAQKLYGVTMQERGVSTMVSVSLADIR
ncbi:chromosome segregation protein SMC [Pseudobdellovibrio exovorus]|uniref:Chromosome partition protein Smc n=1 Tax=Pseudobdellovibrio exovorus JSS TaxID=1184267 RepID=M4V939_9BACT|nr:chromosome segregation protein SMC [Pseudobdellovibrio exovorus]AGH95922.1 chromosome segregation SMC protein [Pseudobdellovibrio exovorus JSS]